uniref:Uncharacterized protein n=1 Tax=Lutzomyia longipalpis TaxID=7200 RepID=A0A7G3B5P0_LUTLO
MIQLMEIIKELLLTILGGFCAAIYSIIALLVSPPQGFNLRHLGALFPQNLLRIDNLFLILSMYSRQELEILPNFPEECKHLPTLKLSG